MTPQKCPKCSGSMDPGFVIDSDYGTRRVGEWASGPPRKSIWTATKMPDERIPIGTYRCSSCGYLESYARPEFAAK